MWQHKLLIVLFVCWSQTPVLSQWFCQSDAECSDLSGAVCRAGACACRAGTQLALGGTACVDVAPYHTSECIEDHQCSRLFMMFECRKENGSDATPGGCWCQAGHHYFQARCWPSAGFGEPCVSDAHCMPELRDPYALKCDGTCVCADGYYERQRGECRKIGYQIGDGCVLDEDCQFENGVCDISAFKCYDSTAPPTPAPIEPEVEVLSAVNVTVTSNRAVSVRSHSIVCDVSTPCPSPFECSTYGGCICPLGYYLNDAGTGCNAELGSLSTETQCVGLLAEVIDGVCTCPPNFFFEENMRDCVKVTRRITDSCVSDENCFTFGAAARCGAPQDPWQMRSCECDTERSVWDAGRQMCRLFAGIGEECAVDSDCLAGELEIQCVSNTCTCPSHLTEFEGLCLTTGLGLGDACQATPECTATANTVCYNGQCSCGEGYQEDDGFCAAIIGGSCTEDSDCVISNTLCLNQTTSSHIATSHLATSYLATSHLATSYLATNQASLLNLMRDTETVAKTCQCRDGYVTFDDVCWTISSGFESRCNVTSQCEAVMGDNSVCLEGACNCVPGHHHRDGGCWPVTGLFEPCTRTSQCFLQGLTERTVCRNSVCQCTFNHPYNEQMHTCGDGIPREYYNSANIVGKTTLLVMMAYLTTYL